MSKLKHFDLRTEVKQVSGYQFWSIVAEDAEDAIARFNRGESCEFIHEEIEVIEIGEPEVVEDE